MKRETTVVGKFKLDSGRFRVSDPCYAGDSSILNAEKGTWIAIAEHSSNGRWNDMLYVAELIAVHENFASDMSDLKFEEAGFTIDVDSGQAGIFDEKIFVDDPSTGKFDPVVFNEKCSSLSFSPNGSGVVDGGVVSESGGADGTYDCFSAKANDSIVAIKIIFLKNENNV